MKNKLLLLSLLFSLIFNTKAQDFEWAHGLEGTMYNSGKSIAYDESGNIYVTGRLYDEVDFDPGVPVVNLVSNGGSDIYILKLDPAGNFIWAKQIGGTGEDQPSSIFVDAEGATYISGFFNETVDFDPGAGVSNLSSNGGKDIFVVKLNAAGNFDWAKHFGGPDNDEAYDISVDENRFVYATGIFSTTADFDPGAGVSNLTSDGGFDGFVFKLLPSGDLDWVNQVGGLDADQAAFAIDLDGSNNIYTTGYFREEVDFDPGAGTANMTATGMRDCYILKYDNAGNYDWVKTIGGGFQDYGKDITIDDVSGDVFVTGEFQFTVDFDPGIDTVNLVSDGLIDAYVLKLDANGDYQWAKNYGGPSFENSVSIGLDGDGNVYTTGNFYETADFDPGAGTANLTASAGSDIFILKLDPFGDYIWAGRMGDSGDDLGQSIAVDADCNIYTTGYFLDTADFNPGAGTHILNNAGGGQTYILKLSCELTSSIAENEAKKDLIQLYPNPANSYIVINGLSSTSTYNIVNTLGEIVQTGTSEDGATIGITSLSPGIYFIHFTNATPVKFIVE